MSKEEERKKKKKPPLSQQFFFTLCALSSICFWLAGSSSWSLTLLSASLQAGQAGPPRRVAVKVEVNDDNALGERANDETHASRDDAPRLPLPLAILTLSFFATTLHRAEPDGAARLVGVERLECGDRIR